MTPPTGVPSVPSPRSPDDHRPSPPPPTVVEPCACGHARAAHSHYRRGTDCGVCGAAGCPDFRPRGGSIRRALRRMGVIS